MSEYKKKLIEVALPLEAINKESAREKSIRHGHPSTLHLWWARRPLAACRAVLFASIVDDPSSHPEQFPDEEEQEKERKRLFRIIEELVKWDNINNEAVFNRVSDEIIKTTDGNPPQVYDPFCGGGSIPLEAQRLGLEAFASDLNPVAVLITKALIEIPPKFDSMPPVNPESRKKIGGREGWKGARGLAEDVRFYAQWMRNEAENRIGHLYPKVKLTKDSGADEGTAIAWLWARTVRCPNPACGATMPLVRSFLLSKKKGRRTWVEPLVDRTTQPPVLRFEVKRGTGELVNGTVNRRGAHCVCCQNPVSFDYIRREAASGHMGTSLMAIVAEGPNGQIFCSPNPEHESIAKQLEPKDAPDTDLPAQALGFRVQPYGMKKHKDLFTNRQLLTLSTFSSLLWPAREMIFNAACRMKMIDNGSKTYLQEEFAADYANALTTYLAFCFDRLASLNSSLCWWNTEGFISQTFARPTLSMVWDFAECNPFSESTGNWTGAADWVSRTLSVLPANRKAYVKQADAANTNPIKEEAKKLLLVSTDPPYYDNIGYADLSDFFYIWLRRNVGQLYPDLFSTVLTPKNEELIASPDRFQGDSEKAKLFFETGLSAAFKQMSYIQTPAYPLSIYYAFRQTELEDDEDALGRASTGWETMLTGLCDQNFLITGTWPLRTERATRPRDQGSNALASSIVLVCRVRPDNAPFATRREFLSVLKRELPEALRNLQKCYIAPVDLAQAAIGPGMAVFTRYSKVIEADGTQMKVRTALALINQALDEMLAEQEGEFDADTRWAIAWFEQFGINEGPYGMAETLSKAKNTSVEGLAETGILIAKAGKVRLFTRNELLDDWNPLKDKRITVWEITQYLIRDLERYGEERAAGLIKKVGSLGETARDLAYRLYTICERKGWAQEALAYNSLVISWPEISRLAQGITTKGQGELL